jgi:quercetin dioxygenase-like cupin family protein
MILTIDSTPYELEGGASWSIKSGVPHGVQMLEDCTIIEVFSPVREDYID